MNHRYRLPDAVKERQARELRERFARSHSAPPTRGRAKTVAGWLAAALLAWAAWKGLR